eukprot:CAMPEP_0118883732 /NCGR_PEP_ID=MMETSP1163-20130328/22760_1 /TAXON_ID=124430 /ORGANISM="Phaeomonas parva, Strain CCMP2877" /LENGTH=33 /DNA_ID= /DNA_START= /DNA_END= /DNA_ORIENTATION=
MSAGAAGRTLVGRVHGPGDDTVHTRGALLVGQA